MFKTILSAVIGGNMFAGDDHLNASAEAKAATEKNDLEKAERKKQQQDMLNLSDPFEFPLDLLGHAETATSPYARRD